MSLERKRRNAAPNFGRQIPSIVSRSKSPEPLPKIYEPSAKTTATTSLLRPPIEQMDIYDIEERLSSEVMHQSRAIYHISNDIYEAWQHHKRLPHKPHIRRILLSGPSGCGKTETVSRIRHYLGMDKGYMYERQCIWYDASTSRDETANSRLSGASAGYMGCDDGTSLPDRLCQALEDDVIITSSEEKIRTNSKKHKELYNLQEKRKKQGLFRQPPPVILLFIDEIDKAYGQGMVLALNGLLDTGRMTSARGKEFVLPMQTTLLCMFTANYAAEEVASLDALASYEDAQWLVEQAIMAKGAQKCSLERFGHIAVYFALSQEQLHEVLLIKLDSFMQDPHWQRLKLDNDNKQRLIARILEYVDRGRGIRHGTRIIMEQLGTLFGRAYCDIERLQGSEEEVPVDEELQVCMHTFSVFEHQLTDTLQKLLEQKHSRDEWDRRISVAKRGDKDSEQEVHALAVHRGSDSSVVAINLMPSIAQAMMTYMTDTGSRMAKMSDALEEVVKATESELDDSKLGARVRQMHDNQRELLRTHGVDRQDDDVTKGELKRFGQIVANTTGEKSRKRRQSKALTNHVEEMVIDNDESTSELNTNMTDKSPTNKKSRLEDCRTCKSCGESKSLDKFENLHKENKKGEACYRGSCFVCRNKQS